MKKFLFALLTLGTLSAMHASAQDSSARWSIGLAAGPAFPVGKFHSFPPAEDGSSGSGAKSGGSIELSGTVRVWRALRATLVIQGQENKGYGIEYWFQPPGVDRPLGSNKGNDWKIARALAGAVYSWPLTKKTGPAILFRLLGGVQRTISPDFKGEFISTGALTTGPPPTVTFPGLTFPWCFSYEADAGLQWRFHGRLSAIGYLGYQGAKPSIKLAYINSIDEVNDTYTAVYRKSSYATNSISLRAGVCYALTR
jgi:hypothetical protein